MITKACVWPHSSRVKNPKHATHSSLVIGTSLALPAISDLFVGQKNSINTFPLSNSQTDYESPEFPRAASSTLSVSWLDFFFIPLGFFFFFFPSISQILYLDCLEEQLLETAGTLNKQIQYENLMTLRFEGSGVNQAAQTLSSFACCPRFLDKAPLHNSISTM